MLLKNHGWLFYSMICTIFFEESFSDLISISANQQRLVCVDCASDEPCLRPLCPRDMLITSLDPATTFAELCEEVRAMCRLPQGDPFTLKWVDSEGSCGHIPLTKTSRSSLN